MSTVVSSLRARLLSAAPFGVALVFALAATVGVVSGGAFGGIGIGGALFLALCVWVGHRKRPVLDWQTAALVLALLALGGVSTLFAMDPHVALNTNLKLATIFVPLMFWLSPSLQIPAQSVVSRASFFALLLCAGFLLLDVNVFLQKAAGAGERDFLVSKLNRGFSYGALLALPLLFALFARRDGKKEKRDFWIGWILLGCLAFSLFLTNSRATQTGVLLALGIGVSGRFMPKLTLSCVGGGVLLALFWPVWSVLLYEAQPEWLLKLPDSWLARVEIWDYVGHRVFERPITGYGIGNSHLIDFKQPHGALYLLVKNVAAHPHNAAAQLWVELGLGGLIWGGIANFWVLRRISRLAPDLRPYGLAAYVLALWLCLVAYNLWTDSLWGAFALTAYAFAVLDREAKLNLR